MPQKRLEATGAMVTPPEAQMPVNAGKGCAVALLVNGPSLTKIWTDDYASNFEVIVAMNTAAWMFPHDYWVATDKPLIKEGFQKGVKPRKGMVCYAANKMEATRYGIPWLEIPTIPKVKPFTFPRAIIFSLAQAGANGTLTIFGVDWTDSPTDVAGQKGWHTDERWKTEAAILRQIWDKRIIWVHGVISDAKLDFFASRRQDWPT
jgi:hypothetical protein